MLWALVHKSSLADVLHDTIISSNQRKPIEKIAQKDSSCGRNSARMTMNSYLVLCNTQVSDAKIIDIEEKYRKGNMLEIPIKGKAEIGKYVIAKIQVLVVIQEK